MSRYNYFNVLNFTDGYDFPTTPQINFGFMTQAFSFLNRGTTVVEYSFNGTTIHGDLNPIDASQGVVFDNRLESKVWFKSDADGYGTVRIEAWGSYGRS